MAIAVDGTSANSVNDTTTNTVSHIIGNGSNKVLVAAFCLFDAQGTSDSVITGVGYAGQSLSKIRRDVYVPGQEATELWYLANPPSGTANLVGTTTGVTNVIDMAGISFTGASQSGIPDSQNGGTINNTATGTMTTTAVQVNCFLISVFASDNGNVITLGGGQTSFMNLSTGYDRASYSGPQTGTGLGTHTYADSTGTTRGPWSMITIAPAAAPASTFLPHLNLMGAG